MSAQTAEYQVFKRPMTDAEGKSMNKVFKNAKKQALPAGLMGILFGAIAIVNGTGSLDFSTSNGIMSIFIIVIGLFAFGTAMSTFRTRRNVRDAMNEGNVVVVRGSVTRFQGRGNISAMVVGPLSIASRKRSVGPLQEGTFADVACVPRLKSVVSINGVGLDQPIKIMVPNDLETRAPLAPTAYPAPPLTAVKQNPTHSTNGMNFCPSCGNPISGLAFCSNCGTKL